MSGTLPAIIVLALLALVARLAASLLRGDQRVLFRAGGWLAWAGAVWTAVGALSGWCPAWPVALLAALGFFAPESWARVLRMAFDAFAFVPLAFLSQPALAPWAVAAGGIGMLGAGFLSDEAAARLPPRVRPFAFCVPLGIIAAAIALPVVSGPTGPRFPAAYPFLGIMVADPGRRVVLPSGTVAWLKSPRRSGQNGAVLFHGAHPAGSRDKASAALRRALLSAGFLVLSVDHPGYGASPAPPPEAPLEAWNPFPGTREAVAFLRERGVSRVLAVGHSMGCGQVLRILAAEVPVEAAVLFGAGLLPATNEEYWYRRFHQDRRLTWELPLEKFRRLRELYYDNEHLARSLPAGHPPLLFVEFEHEGGATMAPRDRLFSLLPEPKSRRLLLGVSHYFSTLQAEGLVIGDTRATRAARDLLTAFARQCGMTQ